MTARTTRRNSPRRIDARHKISRWKLYTIIGVTAAILVSGFFFAARQQFLSWDFGIKNSRLRKQIDELETEKRRLLLARENSSSPTEIKRVAKKLGMLGEQPIIESTPELASLRTTDKPLRLTETKITKTVDVKPTGYAVVPASLKSVVSKAAKPEREARREMPE